MSHRELRPIYYLFSKHSIPGSSFPSKYSSVAPPPVEICVILSENPPFSTAATESPPPTIVIAFISDRTFAIAFVPFANFSNSNTPNGPFHITVLAFFNTCVNSSIAFGPISNPCHPFGISFESTTIVSASFENSFPQTVSIGNNNLTPFFFFFSLVSFAISSLSN